MGGYKTRPYGLRNPRNDKKESGARNDNSLRVVARHDSAEAIPSSRCEGIPSFKIHDAEAISVG